MDSIIFLGRKPSPISTTVTKKQARKLAALRRRREAVQGVRNALNAEQAARRLRCGEARP